MSRALSVTEPLPTTDAFEILQGNAAFGAFRGLDQGLADTVVCIALETLLAARQLSKPTLGRLCANRLKDGATMLIPLALGLDLLARENVSVTGNGNVHDTQINAEPSGRIELVRFGDFADLMEIPFTVSENQISLTLSVFKKLKLTFASKEWHALTPAHRPDVDRLVSHSPRKNAFVIGDRSVFLERALVLPVEFVRVCDLGFSTYRYLRRQSKLLPNGIVAGVVEIILHECLGIPSHVTDVVARGIGLLKRIKKCIGLLFGWLEFHLCYQFHRHSIAQSVFSVKY